MSSFYKDVYKRCPKEVLKKKIILLFVNTLRQTIFRARYRDSVCTGAL